MWRKDMKIYVKCRYSELIEIIFVLALPLSYLVMHNRQTHHKRRHSKIRWYHALRGGVHKKYDHQIIG